MKHLAIMLISVSLITLSGCGSKKDQREHPIMVKSTLVKSHGAEFEIIYPGKTVSSADINVSFRIAGPIVRIPVSEGEFVHKGQTIAQMDQRDYQIQLEATEAEYKRIKGEAERVMELFKRGSATANDNDKAVYGLQQITQKLEAHRNALNDTRLTAPVDGYIQKKYFKAGETVAAGMPVISMIGNNGMEIEINIPTSDYMRRDKFNSFTFTSDDMGNQPYPIQLIGVTRKANLNQLYNVRFRIDRETAKELTAGMSVNVKIGYSRGESHLVVIPLTALFEKEGKSAVWIYKEDSTVEPRYVTPCEILRDDRVIIDEQLKAGERIITAGVHKIQEGMKVALLPEPKETNIGGLL